MKSHPYNHPLDLVRATASKVLGAVVHDFFPGSRLVSSQISAIGFSCTFSLSQPLDEKAIPLIEERARSLIKQEAPIKHMEMMRQNGSAFLEHHGQPFLADTALEDKNNTITLVQIGNFIDLMDQPCGETTAEAGAIKLLGLAIEDEYVRINATAAENPQDLKKLVKRLEAANKSDHSTIGREMQLFVEIDPDRYLWLPKGAFLKRFLCDYLRKYLSSEQEIQTPLIKKEALIALALEQSKLKGPPRWFELKNLVNKTPTPIGLFQTAHAMGDRGYLFCGEEELQSQLISSLQFIDKTIKIFGFEHHWHLSRLARKWPHEEKYRKVLEKALQTCEIGYIIDKESPLKQGPYAEVRLVDQKGREWPGPSIEIDCTPYASKLTEETAKQALILVERSVFGSIERWIALIVEKYAGRFPLWIAPEQVRVASIGSKTCAYAQRVAAQLKANGFRVGTDDRDVILGAKVHAAEIERIPYCVIVGEKEEKNNVVTIRTNGQETVQNGVALEALIKRLSEEVLKDGPTI